ncbi:YbaB/EbfC family nucleoid-associated protein [Malacoplasma muris]|uniref:YbaB/EbfC family nucleoid-associated protein n=1 Tax=Malacoplasma muris TaxID=2119 RepID=UPI00398E8058
MNMQKILAEAKKMQASLDKKIAEFDSKEFEYNYKNYISIKIKGNLEIISISIDNQLVDPEDKNILEEMVAEAVNEAVSKTSAEKNKVTQIAMPKMPF